MLVETSTNSGQGYKTKVSIGFELVLGGLRHIHKNTSWLWIGCSREGRESYG